MRTNRLWIPTGAVPDEEIGPDCEGALVDEWGRVVVAVYPASVKRCVDCNAELPSNAVLFLCDDCRNGGK